MIKDKNNEMHSGICMICKEGLIDIEGAGQCDECFYKITSKNRKIKQEQRMIKKINPYFSKLKRKG